jgi:ATP-dependent Clp protease ATP-binding subunit ClpC
VEQLTPERYAESLYSFNQVTDRRERQRMFETYTDNARRVIFFSRYEASQYGSPYIETQHLLLGVLREDKALVKRLLGSYTAVRSIRNQIESQTIVRERLLISVDLPFSAECKRVLAYAAEEAKILGNRHIGNEHLLLGIFREGKCLAAKILKERGVQVEGVREELARTSEPSPSLDTFESTFLSEPFKDLAQAALTKRLETLSQSVESLAAEGKLATARIQVLTEAIDKLFRIVVSHERRHTDPEGGAV